MKHVAIANDFVMNKDVKLTSTGKTRSFINYINNNPNMTQYLVVWCTSVFEADVEGANGLGIPCTYDATSGKEMLFYAIYYNFTLADSGLFKPVWFPQAKDPQMTYLKLSIDNSIMKVLASERGMKEPPEIDATWSIFP